MNKTDLLFVPHNDLHPDDMDLVEQHDNLIKKNKLSDATALLDNNDYQKGFRASLFNYLEEKIQQIQIYLLNKYVAEPDEFYSTTEPTDEEMVDKTYWIQIY